MPTNQVEKRQSTQECKQIVKDIEVILATKLAQKHDRVDHVNQVIRIIADHGSRVFYAAETQTYARMYVDKFGKVWFVDSASGMAICTHETNLSGCWKGFSCGRKLRALVEAFRDYIRTGIALPRSYLGQPRADHSNLWAYGEVALNDVREKAGGLPVFQQPVEKLDMDGADVP